MINLLFLALALILSLPAINPAAPPPEGIDPYQISRKLDELYRSSSSRGEMTMTVATKHYTRTVSMKMWSRGLDDTLAVITSPAKERGTATLKRDREMWNYLPKIDKTIRIPPSMMMASWMGSDFTNDDLMRETSWEKDYTISLAQDAPEGAVGLVYIPKPDAPVTWSKVVGYMELDTYLPTSIEYYDEKGRLVREMTFEEPIKMGGRTIPRRVVLTPLSKDKLGNSTILLYEKMEFDVPIEDNLFSLSALRRRGR
ncbi:MAG: outer membrane lipoprotein-sorting protein [Deltaproteobacteria bacterium]|nr:MAG: outer membrane lipoprotein-sorting protein [Deltaproteobacteria bacterium]